MLLREAPACVRDARQSGLETGARLRQVVECVEQRGEAAGLRVRVSHSGGERRGWLRSGLAGLAPVSWVMLNDEKARRAPRSPCRPSCPSCALLLVSRAGRG